MTPNNTLRQPSPSTGIAVMFITLGTLAAIWAGVWYYYLRNAEVLTNDWRYFVCTGLFLSGVAVAIIGLLVGRIGQEAQNADAPIGEVTAAAVQPVGTPVVTQGAVQPAVVPANAAAPVAPQVPVPAVPQTTTRA